MLFRGTREQCEELVSWLNSLMPEVVKFKFEYSVDQLEFLDLKIFIKDGKLKTDLYVKPTNKQLFLEFNSNHPKSCIESIPYSQALRVVERCTEANHRDQQLSDLKEKFIERKYPSELVDKEFERAKKKNRKSLIFQARKPSDQPDKKVRFIFTHNQSNPPIHMWVREGQKLLARNDRAKDVGKRIQICNKQPKNLQRLLGGAGEGSGRNKITPLDPGCTKCVKKCHACPIINETKVFTSTNTKKTYKIRESVDCDSEWVIYLSTCRKCKWQYVGKSKTPFKRRHSNHKVEIRKQVGGLGHHYGGGGGGGCTYADITITIIEQVEKKTFEFLAERECYWQHQLRVYVQNGGKAHCYRKDIGK